MNLFIFTGNLTKDCRTAFTPNGKAVCNFTVANTTGKGGDYAHTEFIECAIFGKRAEGKLVNYLVKGQKVTVSGEVKVDKREHKGEHYANLSVLVNDLDLGGNSGGQGTTQSPQPISSQATPTSNDFNESDIPF